MKNSKSIKILSVVLTIAILLSTGMTSTMATVAPISDISIQSFSEISDALENPYMGWAKFHYQKTSIFGNNIIKAFTTWKDLEPVKGQYDFSTFETKINYQYWISKGYKFVFTFTMDSPDSVGAPDVPDWLFNEINGDGTYYTTSSGSKGFSPNYSNPDLIAEHEKLIKALANRYDNDNTYQIQLGSLGHWGEFHTCYITDTNAPGAYPKIETESQYINAYYVNFKNTYMSLRRPREAGIQYGMSLHNHGFGDVKQTYNWFLDFINKGFTDYYTKEIHPADSENWLRGPDGAEFINWPFTQYLSNAVIDDVINQAKLTHVSWLMAPPPETTLTDEVKANMNKLLKEIGYRLVLNQIQYTNTINATSNLDIKMNWQNTGVAPCFFDWPMEIGLINSTGDMVYQVKKSVDLKSWIPGSKEVNMSLAIPDTVADGNYKISVSIINPQTNLPGVKLAFDAENFSGRYIVGDVEVNKSYILPGTETEVVQVPETEVIPETVQASVSSIVAYGSDTIKKYSTDSSYKYSANIFDQNGSLMPDEEVIWSVSPENSGVSINSTGVATIAGNTALNSFTIKVSSKVKPDIYDTKAITIVDDRVASSIKVYGSTTMQQYASDSSYKFNANIYDQTGTLMSNEVINWSVSPVGAGVNINSDGVVTLAASATIDSYTVKVTSLSNPSLTDTKIVSVVYDKKVSSLSITGVSSIETQKSSQYAVNVYDQKNNVMSNEAITWSVSPTNAGVRIDSNGLVSIDSSAMVDSFIIKAVSQTDTTVYDTKSVLLINDAKVTSIKVYGLTTMKKYSTDSSYKYNANIFDQSNSVLSDEVTVWSVTPSNSGVSIDSSGVVTLSASASVDQFTVKASSRSNSSIYDTKTVTVIDDRKIASVKIYGLSKMSKSSSTKYSANAYDQYNTVMVNEAVKILLVSPPLGVSIDSNGTVSVSKTTKASSFTIKAVSESNTSISTTKTVAIIK